MVGHQVLVLSIEVRVLVPQLKEKSEAIFAGVQHDNCLSCVRTRKSGVCFASKQNDEERTARNFCGDKNLLVVEIPCKDSNTGSRNYFERSEVVL